MSDVFILGAGFSRAVSPLMPVLAELPDLIRDGLPKPRATTAVWDKVIGQCGGDIEMALSFLAVDQPFLPATQNLRNRADFIDLSRAVGNTIHWRQHLAIERGACPTWLPKLVAEWDKRSAVVMTFNYDTLVEKTYEALGVDDEGTARHVSQLYQVPIATMHARFGEAVYGPSPRPRAFPLLKLHGSTNWFYSGSDRFYGESLYYAPVSPGWTQEEILPDTRKLADKVPFIVPPTTQKSGFFENETVRAQWNLAAFELDFATDLYLVGYSLPASDLLVRFLLLDLSRQVRVHVVNRVTRNVGDERSDDELREDFAEHYRKLLPVDDVYHDSIAVDGEILADFVDAYARGA